jgi:polysaccharide deacetylase 2 family uncharacterized protein YibQ
VKGPELVFVFDDAGQNLSQLANFLRLPFPFTVAVLPGLPHSAEAAARARKAGKEVILHQPMQARDLRVNPGPGAIKPDMPPEEIEALVRRNIAEIAPVTGVNNHEGSLITESETLIGAVLDVCRDEGLYFLDSRTTSETAAPRAAADRGFSVWERDVFLDNLNSREEMLKELRRGLGIANKKGRAIMIGHVWSPLLAELLAEEYPSLKERGYRFVTLSL